MNPLALKLILSAAPLLPDIIAEVTKTAADAKGNTDPAAKIKAIVGDIEELLNIALKVL